MRLPAPPKTTSYWIDPYTWTNWRVNEGEKLLLRFLAIIERDVGTSNRYHRVAMYTLAKILNEQDRLIEAERILVRPLDYF